MVRYENLCTLPSDKVWVCHRVCTACLCWTVTSFELTISLLKYFSLALANHFFLLYSGEEKKVNALGRKTNNVLPLYPFIFLNFYVKTCLLTASEISLGQSISNT